MRFTMAICGYRTVVVTDPSRHNWQGNSDRPIAWSACYPTEGEEGSKRQRDFIRHLTGLFGTVSSTSKARPN
ncbi:MAG: hypothetical protein AAFQ58_11825 [Pseudomonadota bacterium]